MLPAGSPGRACYFNPSGVVTTNGRGEIYRWHRLLGVTGHCPVCSEVANRAVALGGRQFFELECLRP